MFITHHKEKLINTIIFFAKKTKNCNLTKLMKLLYCLDFEHFVQTGESVTDSEYLTYNKGPVSEKVYQDIKSGKLNKYVAYYKKDEDDAFSWIIKVKNGIKFSNKYFSEREFGLLETISYIFKNATANQMTKASHYPEGPWDETRKQKGLKQKIDYFLSLKEPYFKNKLTEKELKERYEETKLLKTIFNAK